MGDDYNMYRGKSMSDVVDNYLNPIQWRIELEQIPEDKGGGWTACTPEFGRYVCIGDGDFPNEAVQGLKESLKRVLREYSLQGLPIPASDISR